MINQGYLHKLSSFSDDLDIFLAASLASRFPEGWLCHDDGGSCSFQSNLEDNPNINNSSGHAILGQLMGSQYLVLQVKHQDVAKLNVIIGRLNGAKSLGCIFGSGNAKPAPGTKKLRY